MSTIAIIVPLLAASCFGLLGPVLARRLPPRHATWLISVGATLSALGAIAVLALVAAVLVGQLPDVAGVGHWSPAALRLHELTEPGVGAVALVMGLASAVALTLGAIRQGRDVVAAYRVSGELDSAGELVVIDDPRPSAVAVPGRPGRIVVSRPLLRRLSKDERRVLLAHERAHLEAGHHWHRGAVALAVRANPLLAPLAGAITHATERWADERAAAELGDRPRTASALARVALLTGGSPASRFPRLAAGGDAVPARVSALLAEPPRTQPALSLAVIGLLTLGLVAVLALMMDVDHLFDLAGQAYRISRSS